MLGFIYKDHCPKDKELEPNYSMKGKRSIKFIYEDEEDKGILNKELGKDRLRNQRLSQRKKFHFFCHF